MKYVDYAESLDSPGKNKALQRQRLQDARNVARLEGYLGNRDLDIAASKWANLTTRLATFGRDDWRRIKSRGDTPISDVVPELKKSRRQK